MLSVSIQAAISSLDAIVLVVVTNEDSTTRKPLPQVLILLHWTV